MQAITQCVTNIKTPTHTGVSMRSFRWQLQVTHAGTVKVVPVVAVFQPVPVTVHPLKFSLQETASTAGQHGSTVTLLLVWCAADAAVRKDSGSKGKTRCQLACVGCQGGHGQHCLMGIHFRAAADQLYHAAHGCMLELLKLCWLLSPDLLGRCRPAGQVEGLQVVGVNLVGVNATGNLVRGASSSKAFAGVDEPGVGLIKSLRCSKAAAGQQHCAEVVRRCRTLANSITLARSQDAVGKHQLESN